MPGDGKNPSSSKKKTTIPPHKAGDGRITKGFTSNDWRNLTNNQLAKKRMIGEIRYVTDTIPYEDIKKYAETGKLDYYTPPKKATPKSNSKTKPATLKKIK
jgi:hypothetical protein